MSNVPAADSTSSQNSPEPIEQSAGSLGGRTIKMKTGILPASDPKSSDGQSARAALVAKETLETVPDVAEPMPNLAGGRVSRTLPEEVQALAERVSGVFGEGGVSVGASRKEDPEVDDLGGIGEWVENEGEESSPGPTSVGQDFGIGWKKEKAGAVKKEEGAVKKEEGL